MYNANVLEKARAHIAQQSMPFLDIHRELARATQPYKGLFILQNIPLTLITLFKAEVLVLGGAEVILTSPAFYTPNESLIHLAKEAGFHIQRSHPQHESFDLHLDCCAELLEVPTPRLGAVELTQSGSMIYQTATFDYPVISVDDSPLKVLETFLGTGDGFYRALHAHVGEAMRHQAFVIFGYGKVGQGIANALRFWTDDITVIDIKAPKRVQSPAIRYIAATDKKAIEEAIKRSYCTVTATGVKDLITSYYGFNKTNFGSSLLINMGAEDEYGSHFSTSDVLFDKRAFNFSLNEPTAFRYLDPIFYAHNYGVDLILSKQYSKGYHPFPASLSKEILEQWQTLHQEDIGEALKN